VGETYEGERIELELDVARKLYRCPACRGYIGIGQEHVFVRYPDADAGAARDFSTPPRSDLDRVEKSRAGDHEHWHRSCVAEKLMRSLASSREVTAPRPPKSKGRGRRR
jgi:hypothetical protein